MKLTLRQQRILSAIVELYIQTAEPVGSKLLTQYTDLGVSSATIRSEMASLYERGYLEQPHTSAGRVPSHLGYREYIDSLMTCQPLTREERDEIDSLFNVKNPDPERLLGDAAEALSDFTGYASVTSSMVPKTVRVRRIELIAAGQSTVVVLLITSNGIIRSRVCRVDFEVTPELIDFFNKFANARFAGRSIGAITSSYINSVTMTLGEYSRIFTLILLSIFELCLDISEGKYYISGSVKLLGYGEAVRMARDILTLLDDKDRLQELFPSASTSLRVVIGKENQNAELTESAVVTTQYAVGGESAGMIGLIGPVRINYARLIPHLEYFAKTLGELLEETLEGE